MIDRMNWNEFLMCDAWYSIHIGKKISLEYNRIRNFYPRWKNGGQMELLLAIINVKNKE